MYLTANIYKFYGEIFSA